MGSFPNIFIHFNEEERNRFAGHALRMFQSYLGLPKLNPHVKSYENQVCTRLARTTRLARYLVKLHPGPRRSVATQTDAD